MRSRASAGVRSRQRLFSAHQIARENFQDFVLETAAFARVQFKNLPFLGAQAGMDEKPERTLGEFLQPADGGLQHRAVKFFRQRGRKIFRRVRLAQGRKIFRRSAGSSSSSGQSFSAGRPRCQDIRWPARWRRVCTLHERRDQFAACSASRQSLSRGKFFDFQAPGKSSANGR